MKIKEQQATVWVNGEEVWTGDWWKAWNRVRVLVADHRSRGEVKIDVVLHELRQP